MIPDSMTVRLKLQRIRVVEVVVDLTERLEIVVSDVHSLVTRPLCGCQNLCGCRGRI